MAEFCPVSRLSSFLDRHLILLLLDHVEEAAVHPVEEIDAQRLVVLEGTSLYERTNALHQKVNGEPLPEADDLIAEAKEELNELKADLAPLFAVLEDKNIINNKEKFTVSYLGEEIADLVEDTLHYGKQLYEEGQYAEAAKFLKILIRLANSQEEKENDMILGALYGALSADIMGKDWDGAKDSFDALQNALQTVEEPHQLLQHRSWVLTSALFPVFLSGGSNNEIKARVAEFAEVALSTPFMNAVETNCPHMLRYVAAATLFAGGVRNANLKALLAVLRRAKHQIGNDPLLGLIHGVLCDYNFGKAEVCLASLASMLAADPFLSSHADIIMSTARQLVLRAHTRVHHVIDIESVADQLKVSSEQTESWVVEEVRSSTKNDVVARMDAQAKVVRMDPRRPSVYDQVIGNTDLLLQRAETLVESLRRFSS